eukprot:jgi/Ulvmu1/11671/UM008_0080.1
MGRATACMTPHAAQAAACSSMHSARECDTCAGGCLPPVWSAGPVGARFAPASQASNKHDPLPSQRDRTSASARPACRPLLLPLLRSPGASLPVSKQAQSCLGLQRVPPQRISPRF